MVTFPAFDNSTCLPGSIYIDTKWLEEADASLDEPEENVTVVTKEMAVERESNRRKTRRASDVIGEGESDR